MIKLTLDVPMYDTRLVYPLDSFSYFAYDWYNPLLL